MTRKPKTEFEDYFPTVDEVRALADANSRRAPTGKRNRALVLTLASTGLRIGEALALKPTDLNLDEKTVHVQVGKRDRFGGDSARVTAIVLPEAIDALGSWMDTRKSLGITGHKRVFCTLKGEPMSDAYVRQLLPRLAKRAGILGRIHAHGFRHFFAKTAVKLGIPSYHIQKALGHKRLATTEIYLRGITNEETLEALHEGFAKIDD